MADGWLTLAAVIFNSTNGKYGPWDLLAMDQPRRVFIEEAVGWWLEKRAEAAGS